MTNMSTLKAKNFSPCPFATMVTYGKQQQQSVQEKLNQYLAEQRYVIN